MNQCPMDALTTLRLRLVSDAKCTECAVASVLINAQAYANALVTLFDFPLRAR